ncbi:DsbA family protein [Pseudogemmobacter sp. W21_MBD1_M6]|uniref:DsbA family protein n=1 Tax=Pseudogemmobacter sp. W21_MBD1_M6 TaxID=3240271 RepID=UPI003F9AF90B
MTRLTLVAAFAALTLATPALAFDVTAMTDTERAALRAEIRTYLVENPEVLVEAINALESRQAEAQVNGDQTLVEVNKDAIFDDGYSWVGGNPDGDLTLVEFSDYRCGYCRKAHPEVAELVAGDGNIRYIIKEFPILGPQSLLSSQFAIAVKQIHGDDLYKQAHDALITLRADATPESLAKLAADLGLDPAPVLAAMAGPEVAKVIDDTRALANRLQINGTPTFVMADQLLRGYVPLEGMQQIAAEIRKQ